MNFAGLWHIVEMDTWDQDYVNMEQQAYIQISEKLGGSFAFGLVAGELEGEVNMVRGKRRLTFTWEGNDELDEVSGHGWLELMEDDKGEGKIVFDEGDESLFWVALAP
ncbi:MAG: hypothetical protein AAF639_41980 [Chloroflexota bacterium]